MDPNNPYSNNPYPQYPPPGQGGVQAPVDYPQQGAPQGAYPGQPTSPQMGYPNQAQGGPQQPMTGPNVSQPMYPQQNIPAAQPGYGQPAPEGRPSLGPVNVASNQGWELISPEIKSELEKDMHAGGGWQDFSEIKYFRPNKPAVVGQTAYTELRILPWKENNKFWLAVTRHFCLVELKGGQKKRLPRSCPSGNTPEGEAIKPCAICDRRERALAVGDEKTANALKPQTRYYFNVFNPTDPDSHWVQDKNSGQWVLVAHVFDAGATIFRAVYNLAGDRGPIWDLMRGYYLRLSATRTGPEDMNISYDVIDTGGECPVPQGVENIKLIELDQLSVDLDYNEVAASIARTYPDNVAPQPVYGAQGQIQPPYANPYVPVNQPSQMQVPQPPAQPPQMQPPYANPYVPVNQPPQMQPPAQPPQMQPPAQPPQMQPPAQPPQMQPPAQPPQMQPPAQYGQPSGPPSYPPQQQAKPPNQPPAQPHQYHTLPPQNPLPGSETPPGGDIPF